MEAHDTSRAENALEAYEAGLDLEEAMTDLVTDLRHLAAQHGVDWIKVTDLAEMHYEDESDVLWCGCSSAHGAHGYVRDGEAFQCEGVDQHGQHGADGAPGHARRVLLTRAQIEERVTAAVNPHRHARSAYTHLVPQIVNALDPTPASQETP